MARRFSPRHLGQGEPRQASPVWHSRNVPCLIHEEARRSGGGGGYFEGEGENTFSDGGVGVK